MEKLRSALAFGGILSQHDIDLIAPLFTYKELQAEDYFQPFDKVAKEIAFVESGVLHLFGSDLNGNRVTKYFIRENQFFANLESYYATQPATDAIQAVVTTQLYTISFRVFEQQYARIPNLYIFQKTITEATLLNKIKDNDFLNFGNARIKYEEFLRRYPSLAQQVPQQYIASYLKITPQSLSRIRKEATKKKS